MFLGYVPIDDPFMISWLTTNSSKVPTESSTTPIYRVYGQGGLVATGSLSTRETGDVTGATNATPIVVTAANHGLATGQKVTVASVGGNTAANGTFTITRIDASSFSLDSSVGNGAYTSGGTWKTTGLYMATVTPTTASGYAQSEHYDVFLYATVSTVLAEQRRFGVV